MPSTEKISSQRFVSLDIARGIAIFGMIFIDSILIFSNFPSQQYAGIYPYQLYQIQATLLFVSGASLFFWFQTLSPKQGWVRVLKRFCLLVFGFWIFKWFVIGSSNVIVWEVLVMLGVLTLALWTVRGMSRHFYLITGFIIFLIAVPVQFWLNPDQYWHAARYFGSEEILNKHDLYSLRMLATGFLGVGWYPVFPWLGFGFIGYWFAFLMKEKSLKAPVVLACGSLFAGFSILIVNAAFFGQRLFEFGVWPAMTFPTVLIYLGVNMLLIVTIYKVFDERKKTMKWVATPLFNIGQNAIKFYIFGFCLTILFAKNVNLYFLEGFWDAVLIGSVTIVTLYGLFHQPRYGAHEPLQKKSKKNIIN